MTSSAVDAARAAREDAGLAVEGLCGLVEVAGPDHVAFLDTQVPLHVAALEPGHGGLTARLDRRGRIRAILTVLRLEDRVWLLPERERAAALAADLESFHFREAVEIRDRTAEFAVMELHGPRALDRLVALSGRRFPPEPFGHEAFPWRDDAVTFAAWPWTGEPGGVLIVPRATAASVAAALGEAASPPPVPLDAEALDILRVEAGRPGAVDLDERALVHELGRDAEMVSYAKGCYLGQETVARVHARGRVHRRLLGLVVDGAVVPPPGTPVRAGDEEAGETRSAVVSPSLGSVIALASMRHPHDEPGTVVHLGLPDGPVAARVSDLPLVRRRGPREEAEAVYRRGLDAFREDRLDAALVDFERATLLDPRHVAAWEAVGVVQERLDRLDEAIGTMETLAELDPDNAMAWTNLSRFYAREGRIEDAENAKGKALYLAWKRDAGEAEARRKATQREAETRRLGEERIGLFREVLALDPDDGVANFGLARLLADLGRHAEAVPLLETALRGDAGYSAAWRQLAASLIALGRIAEAREALERGIVAAAAKGDLMPRREMQRMREELGDGEPPPPPTPR